MKMRRWSPIVALSLSLFAVGPACESTGGLMGVTPEKAMSMLPDSVKSSVSGYLGDLGSATKLLSGITNNSQALAAVPQLEPLVSKIGGYTKTLNSLSPDVKKNVSTAYGTQLGDAAKGFTGQVARIKGDSGLAAPLGGLLDKISLFK